MTTRTYHRTIPYCSVRWGYVFVYDLTVGGTTIEGDIATVRCRIDCQDTGANDDVVLGQVILEESTRRVVENISVGTNEMDFHFI